MADRSTFSESHSHLPPLAEVLGTQEGAPLGRATVHSIRRSRGLTYLGGDEEAQAEFKESTGEEGAKRKIYKIEERIKSYGSFDPSRISATTDSKKDDEVEEPEEKKKPEPELSAKELLKHRVKVAIIFISFIIAMGLWLGASQANPEIVEQHLVALDRDHPLSYDIVHGLPRDVISITTTGQQVEKSVWVYVALYGQISAHADWVELDRWELQLLPDVVEDSHYFVLTDRPAYTSGATLRVYVTTDTVMPIALKLIVAQREWYVQYEVVVGIIILVTVYSILVFELMHRTTAAMFGSFWALAALSILHARPSFNEVSSWIDYNTLSMLFAMMVIVGLLTNTGFFEFAAVKAYKIAKGDVWRLFLLLCILIAFVSAFIDNVTTTLLFVPVTIRLCKVINLDPLPFIVAEVIFVNIGGTATAIGDPPNILIVNTPSIKQTGLVNFGNFALHVGLGIILASVAVYFLLKFLFRNSLKRVPNSEVMKEIEMWKRTAEQISPAGEEESIVRLKLVEYIKNMEAEINKPEAQPSESGEPAAPLDISDLEEKYKITDYVLFYKTIGVLVSVILMFFINSFAHLGLNIVWIALLGAITLLIITDVRDMASVLAKVELGTLLFFAGLFVMMRALDEMGVLSYFANLTANMIVKVPEGNARLAVAISLVIWVGGTVGAFIDNIPFTQTMLPIVVRLTAGDLGLPLTPLVWALSYGCCLGGNATAIGASANVVAAGLAEQNGYKLGFIYFTKIGLPCTFVSLLVVDVYLLLTHVLIPWY